MRTKRLNSNLKNMPDGARVVSVELCHWDGPKQHIGRVYVYWPFVVFRVSREQYFHATTYNVTHAPTGYNALYRRTLKEAVTAIRRLRAAADFDFSAPRSKKATTAKRAAKELLRTLRSVA